MAEVEETLRRVPLFSGVRPKDLKKLGRRMTERSFGEGDVITREGERGLGFFVIEDGNATVSLKGEILRTLGPGDHFGEIALIDGGPRSATVTAASDLVCYGLTFWEFRPLVERNGTIAWKLLQALAKRVRAAEQK
jgi:CRP-like cAMP-binding protein